MIFKKKGYSSELNAVRGTLAVGFDFREVTAISIERCAIDSPDEHTLIGIKDTGGGLRSWVFECSREQHNSFSKAFADECHRRQTLV